MKNSLIKRFFLSKLFNIFGLIILALLGAAISKSVLQKKQINKEVSALQQEIARLEQGNQELGSLIQYLQTSRFLEGEARNKFGLAKEGEGVIVITQPDHELKAAGTQSLSADAIVDGKSNPNRWWYYFWPE